MAPPAPGPTARHHAAAGGRGPDARCAALDRHLPGAGGRRHDRLAADPGHRLGDATVDRLVVQGITARVHSGSAFLQNVRFLLELKLSVHWWYDIGLWSDSGDQGLGSLSFALGIGNVAVPSLSDINLAVPSATVTDASLNVSPVQNLDLGSAGLRDLRVDDTKLPASGFGLSGLQLGAVSVASLGAPDATARSLAVGRVRAERTAAAAGRRGRQYPGAGRPGAQRGLAGCGQHRQRAGHATRGRASTSASSASPSGWRRWSTSTSAP